MSSLDLTIVDELVTRHGRGPEALIPVLQGIQDRYHYLPAPALQRISEVTSITPAAVDGVATFYQQFRHEPAGEHRIRVCHGTACHVKSAQQVEDAIRRHLGVGPDEDTDSGMRYTIERVSCVGCCSIAPVVQIDERTYGQLSFRDGPTIVKDFEAGTAKGHGDHIDDVVHAHAAGAPADLHVGEIHVSLDSCCITARGDHLYRVLTDRAAALELPIRIKRVGCRGLCQHGPTAAIKRNGDDGVTYAGLRHGEVDEMLWRHFRPPGLRSRVQRIVTRWIDRLLRGPQADALHAAEAPRRDPISHRIESMQKRIASEHYGHLDPLDLDEYRRHDGFAALEQCVKMPPGEIVAVVEASGLRGRGGAGFPAGVKWRRVHEAVGGEGIKYVICNGDEGDPGAFMDRMLLESFPYRVLEGMIIAALAVGASEGIFYVRHEYPLAVRRVREAIRRCEAAGLLGDDVLGSKRRFTARVVEGAGAFVCGEETALIASIEGVWSF